MHVFKKSRGKRKATLQLIERAKLHNQRALIFCGTTEIADSLGVPVFHSKDKDLNLRDAFCRGEGQFLATVDMFEAGVTVAPIHVAIINSFDSNPENLAQRVSRLTGFEYDNPDKVAKVYIVCTETMERQWLDKALEFFDLSKVKYITHDPSQH
jgi:superfamily II DNA or RNA helicase